jgi:hypothetical protein
MSDNQTTGGWRCLYPDVYPLNDLREHDTEGNCWCDPTDDEGLRVHHSMDRREDYENGRKAS